MPVIVSGGMEGAEHIRWVFEHTGCAAVMLARGALGNPWLFAQVLGERDDEPTPDEVLQEWHWVIDRAEEHLGAGAGRPLPAQVPSLVRGAARRAQGGSGCAAAGGNFGRTARRAVAILRALCACPGVASPVRLTSGPFPSSAPQKD